MKGLKILIGLMLLCSLAASTQAAVTDTVTVTVLIRYLSVLVTAGDPYDFGIVDTASQSVATADVDIQNDGNAAEDFQLQITTSPANLSVEEVAATPDNQDEYQLYAMFDTDGLLAAVAIAAGDYDAGDLILESGTRQGDVNFDSGDNDANDVAAAATGNMWMMFYAPPSISAGHPQQTIVVTVTAVAG
jgi:hypothetical protein